MDNKRAEHKFVQEREREERGEQREERERLISLWRLSSTQDAKAKSLLHVALLQSIVLRKNREREREIKK